MPRTRDLENWFPPQAAAAAHHAAEAEKPGADPSHAATVARSLELVAATRELAGALQDDAARARKAAKRRWAGLRANLPRAMADMTRQRAATISSPSKIVDAPPAPRPAPAGVDVDAAVRARVLLSHVAAAERAARVDAETLEAIDGILDAAGAPTCRDSGDRCARAGATEPPALLVGPGLAYWFHRDLARADEAETAESSSSESEAEEKGA